MRAARYQGARDFRVEAVEAAEPAAGEVQIKVAYAGICGTDLHIFHGHMDARVSAPQSIGHEMSGTVAAVGEGVTGLAVGQPVTVMPLAPCNDCPACRAGHSHICQNLDFIGIETPGALQELWNVPAHAVVALDTGLSLEHAALIEPLAVACHDVRRARLAAGEFAVVVGGGPIGQLIALVAQATGAQVVLFEPNADRRQVSAELGIEALDPLSLDPVALVEERTGGAGADVVFEVAGVAPTALQSVEFARVRGRIVIVAIHPNPVPMNLHRMFWRELEILGARVYEREDFERAAALLTAGEMPVDTLITEIIPLDRVQQAFERLERADAMKLLVAVAE
ncbi:MAG: zinc-dependent alcohol dehydrogenase [Leucobacter sp.]